MMESNNGEETNDKLKGISKEEISGQGILFFIAGFDTTNATFAHILYYLTKYPEWQDNLYEELSKIETEIDYDVLRDLPILNAVVNETLRLKPPLVVFQRAALEDCTLLNTGIKVPRNTLISIQPYIIHRNPEYFPDPEEFKPERFVDNHAEKHFAFMPFGAGSRLCVGMRFAQNELRIGLAKFILTYRLLPNPDLKVHRQNVINLIYNKILLSVGVLQRKCFAITKECYGSNRKTLNEFYIENTYIRFI